MLKTDKNLESVYTVTICWEFNCSFFLGGGGSTYDMKQSENTFICLYFLSACPLHLCSLSLNHSSSPSYSYSLFGVSFSVEIDLKLVSCLLESSLGDYANSTLRKLFCQDKGLLAPCVIIQELNMMLCISAKVISPEQKLLPWKFLFSAQICFLY